MSIYDNGVMYPWEIWVGVILAVLILYFGVRATRKDAHRRQRSSGSTAGAAKVTTATKNPPASQTSIVKPASAMKAATDAKTSATKPVTIKSRLASRSVPAQPVVTKVSAATRK